MIECFVLQAFNRETMFSDSISNDALRNHLQSFISLNPFLSSNLYNNVCLLHNINIDLESIITYITLYCLNQMLSKIDGISMVSYIPLL